MNILEKVAKINDSGVLLLSSGLNKPAMERFAEAISAVADLVRFLKQKESSNDDCSSSLQAQYKSRKVPLKNDPSRGRADTIMYSSGFIFILPEEVTPETLSFASALLFYNYGLSLHQSAGCVGIEKLRRALLCYKQSLDVVLHISTNLDSFEVASTILRNQTDVYYKLRDFHNVRAVMKRFLLLAMHAEGAFKHLSSTAAAA